MNQSQFLAITCNSLEAREKSRVHRAIGFGQLLIGWKTGVSLLSQSLSVAIAITYLLSTVIWKLLYLHSSNKTFLSSSLLHEDEVFQNNVHDEVQDDVAMACTETNKQTDNYSDQFIRYIFTKRMQHDPDFTVTATNYKG